MTPQTRETVEYTPASRTTYSYDANGNTALVNADDSLTTYSWDIENRMTKAELPAGTLNTISYDGDGKRRSLEDSVMRRRKPRTVICFRDAGKVLW